MRDALAVAAPDLAAAIERWISGAEEPRLERTVVAHLLRMAGRPTPFGMSATVSLGRTGAATCLELGSELEVRARVAEAWLAQIARAAEGPVRPNETAWVRGGRIRFLRRSAGGGTERASLPDSTEVRAALASGARDARLVREGLQLPAGEPPVAGDGDARDAVAATLGGEAARQIEAAAQRARAVTSAPAGARPALLGDGRAPAPLVVDTWRPLVVGDLGADVVEGLAAGAELLAGLTPCRPPRALERFAERFAERYGDEEVALLEALDALGLGGDDAGTPEVTGADAARLALVDRALRAGCREVDLTAADLEALAPPRPRRLPIAFAAVATLADGPADGIRLAGLSGPSGARAMGRLGHGDPDLRAEVAAHVEEEEALDPEAAFAEVAYAPAGREAAVAVRPAVRRWHIPCLGTAGGRAIPPGDLRVRLRGGIPELWSAELGRRVVPRITSAHDYMRSGPALYRFLGMLQDPEGDGWIGWSWGVCELGRWLPRIRHGRLVLSPARWRLAPAELSELAGDDDPLAALARLRDRLGMPRHLAAGDGDRLLAADAESPLGAAALLRALHRSRSRVLQEVWPPPQELAVRGPEGRHAHEVVLPFTVGLPPRVPAPPAAPGFTAAPVRRRFPPGSEWVYAKLYAAPADADRVLRDAIAPRLAAIGRPWHFVRYGDPEWHLRVRAAAPEARPELEALFAELLEMGSVWRVELGTYEREVARYGGAEAILLAERVFHADSVAAASALAGLERLGDEAARRRLAVRSVDSLLEHLLGDEADALAAAGHLIARTASPRAAGTRTDLARSFRAQRALLEQPLPGALQARGPALREAGAALAELAERGRLTRPLPELAATLAHMAVNRLLRRPEPVSELLVHDHVAQLRLARAGRARARSGPSG